MITYVQCILITKSFQLLIAVFFFYSFVCVFEIDILNCCYFCYLNTKCASNLECLFIKKYHVSFFPSFLLVSLCSLCMSLRIAACVGFSYKIMNQHRGLLFT